MKWDGTSDPRPLRPLARPPGPGDRGPAGRGGPSGSLGPPRRLSGLPERTPATWPAWPGSSRPPTPTPSAPTTSPSNSSRPSSTACGPTPVTTTGSAGPAGSSAPWPPPPWPWLSSSACRARPAHRGAGYTVALKGAAGVRASARLTSEPWGTAIHLQETGQAGGPGPVGGHAQHLRLVVGGGHLPDGDGPHGDRRSGLRRPPLEDLEHLGPQRGGQDGAPRLPDLSALSAP